MDIFISYAHQDRYRIVPHLLFFRECSLNCLWDRDFEKGPDFDEQIEDGIRRCKVFVLFLSINAGRSKWIQRELKCADNLQKPILVLDLEEVSPDDLHGGISLILGNANRISLLDTNHGREIEQWVTKYFCIPNPEHTKDNRNRNANDILQKVEIAIKSGQLATAKHYCNRLEAEGIPQKFKGRFLDIAATLAETEGDGPTIRSYLWQKRETMIRQGKSRSLIDRIDARVIRSIFETDSRDWAESASGYQQFLRQFPHCLQVRLTEFIAAQIQIMDTIGKVNKILDLCCGTGLLPEVFGRMGLPIMVGGYDIPEMVGVIESTARCEYGSCGQNWPGHEFLPIQDLVLAKGKTAQRQWDAAVMNMAFFQFGIRERLILLRHLNPNLKEGALFWISTDGPDFEFPNKALNAENTFKQELHRIWNLHAFDPGRNPKEAVQPQFAKDTVDSIKCLLEPCGFELLSQANQLPLLIAQRTHLERIAFTRLPVISKKVYGRIIKDKWWKIAQEELGKVKFEDTIHGTVLLARKVRSSVPYIFFEAPASPQKCEQIDFAVAAVLRRPDGRTLFVKRGRLGRLVRDYPNTWSLPSSRTREGKPMVARLLDSLKEHFGIDKVRLEPLAVRISRHGERLFVMTLYQGLLPNRTGLPRLLTEKYVETAWRNDEEILRTTGDCGDCLTCYQDVLHSGWRG